MRVAYVRSGGPRDRAYLSRPDGSTATIHPHSYGGGFPHDLAHFAVERALGLTGGFWGLLTDGVDWERVNAAADRGAKGGIDRDVAELRVAEAAVGLLTSEASTLDELTAAYAAEGVAIPSDLATRVADARAQLADLAVAWSQVPEGGQLLLEWPAPE
jgi:hypothetical protein